MSTPYTWRAATYDDLPGLYALLVAAGQADGNSTGTLGLYERLGFVTFRRAIAFNKDLS